MVEVVQQGTGTAAQIPGITVAGKTGTAQTPSARRTRGSCFAPAEHPRIAVAVVVLNGGNLADEATGGQVAAPVAKAVIEAALGQPQSCGAEVPDSAWWTGILRRNEAVRAAAGAARRFGA